MTGSRRADSLRRLILLSPLGLFLLVFFAMPLATVMRSAVSDPVIPQAFPSLEAALEGWDRVSAPTAAMQSALVADLRAVEDPFVLGDAVRRLNGLQAGFRSLMSATTRAVEAGDGEIDLIGVDPRWADAGRWRTIADNLSHYTDRFLLAAVDLQRAPSGAIERVPEAQAANLAYFSRTFSISGLVTLMCVLIGLPYAMLVASAGKRMRLFLLAAILIPMWTSILVRASAWFILMQDNGLINDVLAWSGLTDGPVPLLFTRLGVVLSMTHMLLPFMVLPIYNVLAAIPRDLMPAAAAMGASPLRAFLHILLPLSLRGVISGSFLVFMTSIGFYVLPALLGGPRDQLISSLVALYSIESANWPMASAIGLILFAMTMALYAIFSRLTPSQWTGR